MSTLWLFSKYGNNALYIDFEKYVSPTSWWKSLWLFLRYWSNTLYIGFEKSVFLFVMSSSLNAGKFQLNIVHLHFLFDIIIILIKYPLFIR